MANARDRSSRTFTAGCRMPQLPCHQCHQADCGDRTGARDEVGRKSVVALIPVEHDLQGAETDHGKRDPDVIDRQTAAEQTLAISLQCLRLHDEQLHQTQRQQPDRQIDQEAPVPRQIVGQPAAECRADRRRRDNRQSIQRECLCPLLDRKCVGEDRLLGRCHAATTNALDDTRNQHHAERGGHRTHHRGTGEDSDASHVEALAADHVGQPAADRQHDGVGNQIAGDDPGALVEAGCQTAGDVAQRDIYDRDVEHLHEGRDRDDHRDQPGTAIAGSGARQARIGHQRTCAYGTTDMPGEIW